MAIQKSPMLLRMRNCISVGIQLLQKQLKGPNMAAHGCPSKSSKFAPALFHM